MSTDVPSVLRHCRRCEADHAAADCRVVPAGSGSLLVCPTCGMVTGEVVSRVERPLWGELVEAVKWPARGDNRIAWAALGVGVALFSKLPMAGGALALGVLLSYLFLVIQRGARGEEHAPAAADFETWWDITLPLVRGAAAMVIPGLPLVGALFASGALQVALAVLGAVWAVATLPATLAATAYGGSIASAVNPAPMIALVTRVPADYARTVAVLVGLLVSWVVARAASVAIEPLVRLLMPTLTVPLRFALEAALVFFPLAMARVVAVLLRERADELGIERLPPLSAR